MMEIYIEKEKQIPIKEKVDVLVVGSGPAGFSAAINSARLGASTLLVEQFGSVGGVSTTGLMSEWCGKNYVGTWAEILNRAKINDDTMIAIEHERLKLLYLDMLEEAGANLKLYTYASDAIVEDKKIKGIITESKSGREAIMAKIVIDASGDGDIAAHAGAKFFKGRESDGKMQPMTLMFKIAGVDFNRAIFLSVPHSKYETPFGDIQEIAARELPFPLGYIVLHRSPQAGLVTCNITRALDVDGTNADDLTKAHIECQKQIKIIIEFIRKYVPGYENCFLIDTGAMIGVRETRHFIGEYILKEEDIIKGEIFDDWVVARAHYLLDIHNLTGKGWLDDSVRLKKGPPESGYTIPYRCLVPKEIDGLLLAGRNISGTHVAHSSYRVMSICANTGQAAGIAAALCIKENVNPRNLEVGKIQQILKKQGVEPLYDN
ncbi:MAG: FAD-dependent oxidoreductase [Actinobacteria bacterium]|nr:FAD-dependent oxidoreductase [Actinomycetota bacterium]